MDKKLVIIFVVALALFGALSLGYSHQVLADLKTFYLSAEEPRAELVLEPQPPTDLPAAAQQAHLLKNQQIVTRRLDQLHLAGAYDVTIENGRLVVKLPDSENMAYITFVISSVGEIEFINGGQVSPPLGQLLNRAADQDNSYPTLFTAQELESVALPDPATGHIFYRLVLKPEPVVMEKLAEFVETQPGYYLCMVMDDQVLNCSRMYHLAGNTIEILPELSSSSPANLTDLAVFLDSGPLTMPLTVLNN